jgi:peptidyl-prolyl cis-trans isomerase SurA
MRPSVWIRSAAALLTVTLASAFASNAQASIIERVVAVVGERPLLLTDLRKRAKPYLLQIFAASETPAQQAAQESEMYRELLNHMIDERLEEQAADKARLSVTSEEIDRALKNKAASVGLQLKDLYAEARRQGLREADYRDEVRRQLLEGKLIQLRVMNRVRVSEDDARNAYARWIAESAKTGTDKVVELRILARRLPPGLTAEQIETEQKLAQSIVAKARAGTDFCALVTQYSQDVQTRASCGSRGLQSMSQLVAPLDTMVASLKKGEVSDPTTIPDQAIVVVQLAQSPHVPTFEEVKPMMQERAMGEILESQRKAWLQELRRGVYVDVRL